MSEFLVVLADTHDFVMEHATVHVDRNTKYVDVATLAFPDQLGTMNTNLPWDEFKELLSECGYMVKVFPRV